MRETSIPKIFACGNVVHVHDLVDFVSYEGEIAGKYAAKITKRECIKRVKVIAGENVRYVVPHYVPEFIKEPVKLFMRVKKPLKDAKLHIVDNNGVVLQRKFQYTKPGEMIILDIEGKIEGNIRIDVTGEEYEGMPKIEKGKVICIVCPIGCTIEVKEENGKIVTYGNRCKRGQSYAIEEYLNPSRVLTTTVLTEDGKPVPVRSNRPIPKGKLRDALREISKHRVNLPVRLNEVIIKDVAGTGVDIVATRNMD